MEVKNIHFYFSKMELAELRNQNIAISVLMRKMLALNEQMARLKLRITSLKKRLAAQQ